MARGSTGLPRAFALCGNIYAAGPADEYAKSRKTDPENNRRGYIQKHDEKNKSVTN